MWYYITPDGKLFRFTGQDAPVAAAGRWLWRKVVGEQLTGELVKELGSIDGPWYHENPRRLRAQLFKTITTGPGVLESLVNADNGVLRNDVTEAQRRLEGTLFGPDGKQTCMIFTLTENAKRDLHQVIGRAWLGKPLGRLYEAGMEANVPMEQLRLGGPPIDTVAVDEEGTVTLVRLIAFSVVLGFTLSYLCFRNIMITLMVFFVGGISAVVSMALVSWLGSSADAIVLSMPSLVYVLGLSGAVHLINYYHQAVEEHGVEGAPERAVAHAWKPAFLCDLTTSIGLFCLLTSEILPIRKFGLFSGIAVMVMMVISLTYLPAALQLFPQPPRKKVKKEGEGPSFFDRTIDNFWDVVGSFIIRNHWAVATACTLFIIGIGYGVTRIQTSVNMLKMFDPSSKIINDYTWLEANLGRLVPMEVVLKLDKPMLLMPAGDAAKKPDSLELAKQQAIDESLRLNFMGRMELTDRVQRTIEQAMGEEGEDVVGHAMSAATFAPPLPAASNDLSNFIERRATNKRLEEHRPEFLASDYLREDEEGTELWRISVRLAATKGVDYGVFVANLKALVNPVLDAYKQREQVIRTIADNRFKLKSAAGEVEISDVAQAINPAGARVLVVGLPSLEDNDPKKFDAALDGPRVQATTLVDLLRISRMKVEVAAVEGDLSEEKLAKYESVIVAGEIPGALRATIEKHSKHVIDVVAIAATTTTPAEATNSIASTTTSVSAVYTGVVPIVYKAQRALLDSLIESTFWSFLTITPLMMWVARSFGAGGGGDASQRNADLRRLRLYGLDGHRSRCRLDDDREHRARRGGRRYDSLPRLVPRGTEPMRRSQGGDSAHLQKVRDANVPSRAYQRPRTLDLRLQHLHADPAFWLPDALDPLGRRRGGTHLLPRAARRSSRLGLQTRKRPHAASRPPTRDGTCRRRDRRRSDRGEDAHHQTSQSPPRLLAQARPVSRSAEPRPTYSTRSDLQLGNALSRSSCFRVLQKRTRGRPLA